MAFALPATVSQLPRATASSHRRHPQGPSWAPLSLAAPAAALVARRATEKAPKGSEALSNRIRGLFGSLYTLLEAVKQL